MIITLTDDVSFGYRTSIPGQKTSSKQKKTAVDTFKLYRRLRSAWLRLRTEWLIQDPLGSFPHRNFSLNYGFKDVIGTIKTPVLESFIITSQCPTMTHINTGFFFTLA